MEGPSTAVGESLMRAGDVGMRVVEMARRADDVKNLTDASIAMQNAQVEFSTWQQQNLNESDWLPKWQETVGNVQKTIGEMPLTPDARAQLTNRFSTWSTNGTITVNAEAFRQKGRNAVQSVQNAIKAGDMTGDYTPARQSIEDLRGTGLMQDADIEALSLSIEQSEMRRAAMDYKTARAEAIRNDDYATVLQLDGIARERNLLTDVEYKALTAEAKDGQTIAELRAIAINEDPRKARAKLADVQLPQRDKLNLSAFLDDEMRNKQIAEMKEIADKIAVGEIKNSSQVQFNFIDSPAEQAKLKAEIDRAPLSPDLLVAEMIDLEREIDSFDTVAYANQDKETMMKFVQVSARVSSLPTHVKDELSDKWQKRRSGVVPTTKESYVSEGLGVINQLIKAKENEFFRGSGADKSVKAGKEGEYAAFKLRVTKMHNDLKRLMPDNPTVEQALQIINQVTGQDATEVRLNDYRPIPQQGVEPAMPAGSGFMLPNPLFPTR
jgi:hypothetical protein